MRCRIQNLTKIGRELTGYKHLKWSNYKCRHDEKNEKTIGNAVADLKPALGLTWLGLGFSLTEINQKVISTKK